MMESSVCPLCQTDVGHPGDLRTLRIGCLYNLSEVSDLLTEVSVVIDGVERVQTLWCIRICKECRGDFIGILRQFIETQLAASVSREVDELNPERNIPVRVDGRAMMMTRDEWEHFRETGKPPVQ